jgi:hypothetical protein
MTTQTILPSRPAIIRTPRLIIVTAQSTRIRLTV